MGARRHGRMGKGALTLPGKYKGYRFSSLQNSHRNPKYIDSNPETGAGFKGLLRRGGQSGEDRREREGEEEGERSKREMERKGMGGLCKNSCGRLCFL